MIVSPTSQKESFKVSRSLQDGCESICFHSHCLRYEGVQLVSREGLQLCQAKEEHHATKLRFYETAG